VTFTRCEGAEPPEPIEQARKYLRWCAARHEPDDCLGTLHGRRTLDMYGRYTVTMGIAIAGTFEATKESLKEVLGMVVAGRKSVVPWCSASPPPDS